MSGTEELWLRRITAVFGMACFAFAMICAIYHSDYILTIIAGSSFLVIVAMCWDVKLFSKQTTNVQEHDHE
jgi:Na+-transporting NADH:ubiquinone oxidoreductase subunit NqrD